MPAPQTNNGAGFRGFQEPNTAGSDFNAQSFLVASILARISTAKLVQVQAVTNDGGVAPVGFVDILPLVNQIDGANNAVPHGTVFHCPYLRLQGGANAVILDPEIGDIGIAVFADRDISSAVAARAQANPGSRRRFDMADGLYLGGVLNKQPTQYVQFNDTGGITVVSPVKVTVEAPQIALQATQSISLSAPTIVLDGQVSQGTGPNGGSMTMQGPVTVNTDINVNGVSAHNHVHSGVQGGSGDSGPPVA
jgi:hypothetical protein